ncbi:MAG TPA: hypothetical protein VFB14_05230 [Bryobacteraceae bacterium]|jgi:hypothetical protein|nr:hypothetical protein [Bryobacteraceae bacterium]
MAFSFRRGTSVALSGAGSGVGAERSWLGGHRNQFRNGFLHGGFRAGDTILVFTKTGGNQVSTITDQTGGTNTYTSALAAAL